jgi:hypothetical protein
MLTASEIIQHSANTTARARAVGLNEFMVRKVNTIASIPISGNRTQPGYFTVARPNAHDWNTSTSAGQAIYDEHAPEKGRIWERPSQVNYSFESRRFSDYLESRNLNVARGRLEYERSPYAGSGNYYIQHPQIYDLGDMIRTRVEHDYQLMMPLTGFFTANRSIPISKEANFADHAEFYLE